MTAVDGSGWILERGRRQEDMEGEDFDPPWPSDDPEVAGTLRSGRVPCG